ncbi:glycoside hydrolase family 12 protein [Trichoderma atroviride IMI 206040]|uniref:Glycoside hydrolase family 12 protein n=1 Tax=Hypocrea atroviridis (strain ATCC 20476 / IMI 206040) TaxID=452589 RepID=G9PBX4_HYPAI|nr:glycoside hydrolase family 12 protein [Trichoderma atroviride IMI 206040]EHK39357.1 glycoside hydrolase family 12 protein [Trichoderma atroviride IMI 206040]
MKFSSYLIPGWLIASSGASPISSIEPRAITWCGSFGSQQAGPYTIYHNNWGAATATSGQQCTTFNSLQGNSVSWSTSWTWTGGNSNVKSYSNVALENVDKALSGIMSIPSAWNWQYSGSQLVADVAYDLWLAPSASSANQYEIMIWLGKYGGAGPISSTGSTPIATPTINGVSWQLFKGPNGSTTVFSFVAPSNINSWNGDLKLFFNYLTSSQGVSTSMVVTSLQAGTEPFIGSNAVFTTTQYSISVA